jgi:hypothetical protein
LPDAADGEDHPQRVWPIVITEDGLRTIRETHTHSGRVSGGKSTFYDTEDLERLIDAARDVQPVVQPNGKLQGVVIADHDVGYDIEEETDTNVYTVIT